MAVDKRAKKFKQKHLKNKLDLEKKARKNTPKWKKPKNSKPEAYAERNEPSAPANTRDFDAAPVDVFDESKPSNLDQYLSDSEDNMSEEEREYLEEDKPDFGDDDAPPTLEVLEALANELTKSAKPIGKVVSLAEMYVLDETVGEDISKRLLTLFLESVPQSVQTHIKDDQSKSKHGAALKKSASLLIRFLSDAGTADPEFLYSLVTAANLLIPSLPAAKKEKHAILKQLVKLISNPRTPDAVKLTSFDVLRALDDREKVAKQCYQTLVKMSARTNPRTADSLNMCKNLFASLFDERCYQLAFQQIRQLALHLKTALDKTKHANYSTEVVYTNQFVQALDFWSRCVAQNSSLEALVHPLCQVTLKTISLVPGAQYLPLKFFLVRSLVRLGRHTGVYIPLCGPVIECVLHTSVLTKPGKPSSLEQFDFDSQLHAPAQFLNTKVYQASVLQEFTDVLVESLVLYAKSIAFPELQAPIAHKLRKFAKHEAATPDIKKSLVAVCDRLQANSAFILQHRRKVKFGPKNKAQVDKFLENIDWTATPLGKEAVARAKVRAERQRLAKQALEEVDNQDELEQELEMETESENESEIEAALEME